MRAYCYATCVFRNDAYIPGALVLAHSLHEQETVADLVVLVTPDVSSTGRLQLETVFDYVIEVEPIVCTESHEQNRQYLSQVLSRVQALRLGPDGDLGHAYDRVVLLDADVLPISHFDHLFLVNPPAGILNERAELFKQCDSDRRYHAPTSVNHGRWQWHTHYRAIPHGAPIPATVTDRVLTDQTNYGVNTAVMLLQPSFEDYRRMRSSLDKRTGPAAQMERYRWPDMQYLTAFYSGRWHNVDACFAGLSGYPSLEVLFGTHFAGPKPWQIDHKTVARKFHRFPDFQRWYSEYVELEKRWPTLPRSRRLDRLASFAREALRRGGTSN